MTATSAPKKKPRKKAPAKAEGYHVRTIISKEAEDLLHDLQNIRRKKEGKKPALPSLTKELLEQALYAAVAQAAAA